MTGNTVQDMIGHIVMASKDNLFYICTDTGHMPNNQKFPLVLATAETSSIENWNGIDEKKTRVFDISISILEKTTKPIMVPDGKGGRTRESELDFNLRISARRKQLIGILERIIYYLTKDEFRFRFDVKSDVDFSIINEENEYGLVGMLTSFTAGVPYKEVPCCVDFDEDQIKTYKKC